MSGELVEIDGKSLGALLKSDSINKRFSDMLGKKAPGFLSSILSAVSSNLKLKEADPMSVVAAAAIAATLDLPINSNLGFAHIVPYSGKAQFQMGWKGFVQLALRTSEYATINCAVVHEGELIEHNAFTGDMKFDQSAKKSDTATGYVAYFKLLNGFEKYFYMDMEEMKAHGQKYSKSYSFSTGRWKQDFDSMALKTVLKLLLSKYGILSIGMETAIQADQSVITAEGEYEYTDREENPASAALMADFAEDEKVDPGKKPGGSSRKASAKKSPKEMLMVALNEYCHGDMVMSQEVLQEISYREKSGVPSFIEDVRKASNEDLTRAYDQLQNRIESEK